jgi:peroxiredoxin
MTKYGKTRQNSRWSIWLSVGVLLAVVAFYSLGGKARSVESVPDPRFAAGAATGMAPRFVLADLHGRPVSLEEFRGKVVILDFWATWCPPCKREIPDFVALQSAYGGKGVQIVGIALDEPEKVRAFAAQNGINYPVLLGTDEIARLYGGIDGIPTTFMIDPKGMIVAKFEGYRPKDVFESAIGRMLQVGGL